MEVKVTSTFGRPAMEVLQMTTATVMVTLPVYIPYRLGVSVIMVSPPTTPSCAPPRWLSLLMEALTERRRKTKW